MWIVSRQSRDYAGVIGLCDWPAVLSRDTCHFLRLLVDAAWLSFIPLTLE